MSVQAPGVKMFAKWIPQSVDHLFIISYCKVFIKFSFSLSDLVWIIVTYANCKTVSFSRDCLQQTLQPSLSRNAGWRSGAKRTRVTSSELASLQSLVDRASRDKRNTISEADFIINF